MQEPEHDIPDSGIANEYRMVAEAESNAPEPMLAAQREWDRQVRVREAESQHPDQDLGGIAQVVEYP